PEPPELAEEAAEWGDTELFWITKHGVRMTGMPAFGPTHADRELWDVVALVRRLPELSAGEYAALVEEAGEDGHAHEHGDGGHGDHAH
ncbi:MAG: cytochrome c, partial [Myxococcota bacterium]|nr:cytochrome c [Myxococcota bacterium]